MSPIYKRNCNYCHKYYEGRGKYFCSPSCRHKTPVSEKTKKRISRANLGTSSSRKGKTWIEFYGKERTKKMIKKLSKLRTGQPSTFKGKKHSLKSRKLISLHHADINGSKNPMFGKHHSKSAKMKVAKANSGRIKTKETREKLRKARTGKIFPLEWRSNLSKSLLGHSTSKETREKLRKARLRQVIPSKDTSIEIKMKHALRKNKIKYRSHINIANICQPDIFIKPNFLIQCDGNYWHSPEKNKGKDKKQDKRLRKLGYIILRFKEHKINSNINWCIKRIKAVLNSS